ncbi:hypothetical protein ACWCQP_47495 [Streptomyces chartreusis]
MFNGKRLPNYDFTMELIRQLRPADADLQEEWRQRWMKAKYTATRAAKAQKRLEREAEEAQHRQVSEIERLREEAATELQRASLQRREAEKELTEAQAEAARLREQAQLAVAQEKMRESRRAEDIVAEARQEAERIQEQARQEAERASRAPVSLSDPLLLREFLRKEFYLLTEPGKSASSALLQPRLVYINWEAPEPPAELGDLWRALHLLALRLPQEDAADLRARWRAMALGLVGEVDSDRLVPGLPGVVEPLPFRDRALPMSSIELRDHVRALPAGVGDVEIPGKLQYVLALIREYTEENQLLALYDPRLAVVLDDVTPESAEPIHRGFDRVMEAYRNIVNSCLADLFGSLEDSTLTGPALIEADQALAALVPDPLPPRESWWFHRRRALQKKLTPYLGSHELELQAHDLLTEYILNELTDNNVELVDQPGNAVLWWLRLPYRPKGDGPWNRGRMIHQSHNA